MAEAWVTLPNNERLQIKFSTWTNRVWVYHEGKEMAFFGLTGGLARFRIKDVDVEIETRITVWLTTEVQVRANGNLIFKRRFL